PQARVPEDLVHQPSTEPGVAMVAGDDDVQHQCLVDEVRDDAGEPGQRTVRVVDQSDHDVAAVEHAPDVVEAPAVGPPFLDVQPVELLGKVAVQPLDQPDHDGLGSGRPGCSGTVPRLGTMTF